VERLIWAEAGSRHDRCALRAKPFTPNTKYRVKVTGTRTGGALNLEWTFTTGATNRF